jgi:hypothetical protein
MFLNPYLKKKNPCYLKTFFYYSSATCVLARIHGRPSNSGQGQSATGVVSSIKRRCMLFRVNVIAPLTQPLPIPMGMEDSGSQFCMRSRELGGL